MARPWPPVKTVAKQPQWIRKVCFSHRSFKMLLYSGIMAFFSLYFRRFFHASSHFVLFLGACFERGVAYKPQVPQGLTKTPNLRPLRASNPRRCHGMCLNSNDCKYFTYNAGKTLCLIFDSGNFKKIKLPGFVSGPRECSGRTNSSPIEGDSNHGKETKGAAGEEIGSTGSTQSTAMATKGKEVQHHIEP